MTRTGARRTGVRRGATARGLIRETLTAGMISGLSAEAATRSRAGRSPRWARPNHAGKPVTLLTGPAAALGLLAGLAAGDAPRADRVAVALAGTTAAAVGRYDDLDTRQQAKGLRGHLAALRAGRVTGGAVKVAGIGVGALAAALVLAGSRPGRPAGRAAGAALDAVLIAASANVVNLLDLRPGRAAKAAALLTLPGLRHGGAAVLGAAAGVAPADLAARGMLGDCGANALGAAAGASLAAALPAGGRLAAAGGLVGLILASERVSFSAVIDRAHWLRTVDRLGRPSAPPASPAPPGPDR